MKGKTKASVISLISAISPLAGILFSFPLGLMDDRAAESGIKSLFGRLSDRIDRRVQILAGILADFGLCPASAAIFAATNFRAPSRARPR